MQGLVGPEEIVIAPFTHRLAGSVFEMRDRGQQVLTSWSTCLLGYPETAVSMQNTALELARRQGEPNNLAQVLAHTAIVDYFRNDAQAANEHAQGAIKVSEAHGIPLRLAEGHILQGWARSEFGNALDSLQQIEHGVDAWNQTGARIANPVWYSMLARAYWKHVDLVKARHWLDRAMGELKSTGEANWEAELHRLDGEMLLAEGIASHLQVEERFQHAISVSRSQQARLLELRIVVSLLKLW